MKEKVFGFLLCILMKATIPIAAGSIQDMKLDRETPIAPFDILQKNKSELITEVSSQGISPPDIGETIRATEFPICTESGDQESPAIWGKTVVWMDDRNENWDIYGHNLITKTTFPICTYNYDQKYPAIWGKIVVWQDDRSGNCDIYGYNHITKKIFPICAESSDQTNPLRRDGAFAR